MSWYPSFGGDTGGGGGNSSGRDGLLKFIYAEHPDEYVPADIFSKYYTPYNIIKYEAFNTDINNRRFYLYGMGTSNYPSGIETGNSLDYLFRTFYMFAFPDNFNLNIKKNTVNLEETFLNSLIYIDNSKHTCIDIGRMNPIQCTNIFRGTSFIQNYYYISPISDDINNSKFLINLNLPSSLVNISGMFKDASGYCFIDGFNIIHNNIKDCSYLFSGIKDGFPNSSTRQFKNSIIIPNNCNAQGMFSKTFNWEYTFLNNISNFKPIIDTNNNFNNVDLSYLFSAITKEPNSSNQYGSYLGQNKNFNNITLNFKGNNINISHMFDNVGTSWWNYSGNNNMGRINSYNSDIYIIGNDINASYFYSNAGIYFNGDRFHIEGKNINISHFLDTNYLSFLGSTYFYINSNNIDLSHVFRKSDSSSYLSYSFQNLQLYLNNSLTNITLDTLNLIGINMYPFSFQAVNLTVNNLFIQNLFLYYNYNYSLNISNVKNADISNFAWSSYEVVYSGSGYYYFNLNNVDNLRLHNICDGEYASSSLWLNDNARATITIRNINKLNMAYLRPNMYRNSVGVPFQLKLYNINTITNMSHAFDTYINESREYPAGPSQINLSSPWAALFKMEQQGGTYNNNLKIYFNNIDASYMFNSGNKNAVYSIFLVSNTQPRYGNLYMDIQNSNLKCAFVGSPNNTSCITFAYGAEHIYMNINNSDLSEMCRYRGCKAPMQYSSPAYYETNIHINGYNFNCASMFADAPALNVTITINSNNYNITKMFANFKMLQSYSGYANLILPNSISTLNGIFENAQGYNASYKAYLNIYTDGEVNTIKSINLINQKNTTPLTWIAFNSSNDSWYYDNGTNNYRITIYNTLKT